MGKKVSAAAAVGKEEGERRDEGGQRLSPSSSSSSSSSPSSSSASDSQTLSEEGEAGSSAASRGGCERAEPHRRGGPSELQGPGVETPGAPATFAPPSVPLCAGKEGEVEKEGCVDGRRECEEEDDDSGHPGGLDGGGGARPRPETDASLEEQDEEVGERLLEGGDAGIGLRGPPSAPEKSGRIQAGSFRLAVAARGQRAAGRWREKK